MSRLRAETQEFAWLTPPHLRCTEITANRDARRINSSIVCPTTSTDCPSAGVKKSLVCIPRIRSSFDSPCLTVQDCQRGEDEQRSSTCSTKLFIESRLPFIVEPNVLGATWRIR